MLGIGQLTTSRNVPPASIAMPRGMLNVATSPAPFVVPGDPLPARVDTTPDDMRIRRTIWLLLSACNSDVRQRGHGVARSDITQDTLTTKATVPAASTAMPSRPLNEASVPTPFADPEAPLVPARVETTPEEMTMRRTRWLEVSACMVPGRRRDRKRGHRQW